MMRKNIVIVMMIVVLSVLVLTSCCCCPTCPTQIFEPQILAEISYCPVGDPPYNGITRGMLNYMRDIAPWASYRWGAKNEYQLTSLGDIQMVLSQIGSTVNLIENFHSQPGCGGLPFGYVEYLDGSQDYVTGIFSDSGVEFYKVLGPSAQLTKMYPDNKIAEIVLY